MCPEERGFSWGHIQKGDAGTYRRLYRQYFARLLRLATAILRNEAEAEEVVQEAMLRLFRYAQDGSNAPINNICGFLLATTSNLAIDCARRKGLHVHRGDLWMDAVHQELPSDHVQMGEVQAILTQGLDSLSILQRTCLILNIQESLSLNEIAESLDISTADVRKHIHRAREKLKSRFRSYQS